MLGIQNGSEVGRFTNKEAVLSVFLSELRFTLHFDSSCIKIIKFCAFRVDILEWQSSMVVSPPTLLITMFIKIESRLRGSTTK